ncbi:MAG: T9SS type A sorting domain-containing protein, partial [Flavobacteriales bacterium]|nr:T9SS type A sorting domain-containing protein [Flavobacteriales bacterium]
VQDTTAPVLSLESDEVTIECDMAIELPQVSAEDNCDADVTVVMDMEEIDGVCANERTVIYTWTATDNCGNTDVAVWTINVVDTTAPVFTSVPESNELSCEDAIPTVMATATDNCGEAVVSMEDMIVDGDCPQSYTIVRTWTATDACGNTATASTEYYIYDDVAPVFDSMVSNVNVECADDVPATPEVGATDNCGIATVSVSTELIEADDCGNGFSIVTYTAIDECGNSAEMSYSITVQDNTAPILSGTPAADLVLDCEDEVPAPAMVSADDNCNGELDVDFTEELFGDLPAEGSIADCVLTTPQAYNEDGTVCTGDERWSLLLFDFDNAEKVFYSTIDANFVQYPNGTATLSGSVVRNDDPTRGWNISVEFANGMDWSMWSTQGFPTSFKDDCGLAGDNYLDWTYYVMQAGATLTGWGANDGSSLMLNHAPSSLYYGYQVGVAADNVNTGYGSGGWFTYSGIYNQENVSGSGDFAFEHDCCPQYYIERTWSATDCSGNNTSFTQTISFAEGVVVPAIVNPIGAGEANDLVSKNDTGAALLTLSPNPVLANAKITFEVPANTDAKVEILNLNGQKVAELFNQGAEAGQTYVIDFKAGDLPVGVYLYRLTTGTEIITNRMIINK